MSSQVKYSPLSTEEGNGTAHHATKKFEFPKVTRFKLTAIITIALLSVLLIALSCLQSGAFSHSTVCNLSKESPVFASSGNDRLKFPHTKRRLPQCIIIGARKSGTRALLVYLNIHPDIVAHGEELHFFDDDEFYGQSLEVYRKKMPMTFKNQITIEKTPSYFTTPNVPERVYRMNSTIKLLLILRDPVVRTISDYTQVALGKWKKHKQVETFEEKVLEKDGSINRSYKGISRSVYHRHLGRWLEFFKLEQIHIVDAEQLVEDPYAELYKVEEFLGIEHKIREDYFYFNETKGFYCVQTEILQKCLSESKGRQHPPIKPSVIQKLRDFFRPMNKKLFKMIHREFDWP